MKFQPPKRQTKRLGAYGKRQNRERQPRAPRFSGGEVPGDPKQGVGSIGGSTQAWYKLRKLCYQDDQLRDAFDNPRTSGMSRFTCSSCACSHVFVRCRPNYGAPIWAAAIRGRSTKTKAPVAAEIPRYQCFSVTLAPVTIEACPLIWVFTMSSQTSALASNAVERIYSNATPCVVLMARGEESRQANKCRDMSSAICFVAGAAPLSTPPNIQKMWI
jgi:hypothetical protein